MTVSAVDESDATKPHRCVDVRNLEVTWFSKCRYKHLGQSINTTWNTTSHIVLIPVKPSAVRRFMDFHIASHCTCFILGSRRNNCGHFNPVGIGSGFGMARKYKHLETIEEIVKT